MFKCKLFLLSINKLYMCMYTFAKKKNTINYAIVVRPD